MPVSIPDHLDGLNQQVLVTERPYKSVDYNPVLISASHEVRRISGRERLFPRHPAIWQSTALCQNAREYWGFSASDYHWERVI